MPMWVCHAQCSPNSSTFIWFLQGIHMKVIKDKSSIMPNSDPDGHRQQYPYSYSMHTGADRGRQGQTRISDAGISVWVQPRPSLL